MFFLFPKIPEFPLNLNELWLHVRSFLESIFDFLFAVLPFGEAPNEKRKTLKF